MRVVVLGSGFVGGYLARREPDALHGSRAPRPDRPWFRFDADDESTWAGIDRFAPDAAVIAFPLHRCTRRADLATFLRARTARIVVIGSTSAFLPDDGVVGDDSALDPANARAAAEEELRTAGACVVHAAGIYGAGRNPLDWIRRGLIGNGRRTVNLIHGDDVARACLFVAGRQPFPASGRMVLADGRPRRWDEIVAFAVERGFLADPGLDDDPDPTAKRVAPRTLAGMGFRLVHGDLLAELDRLEAAG